MHLICPPGLLAVLLFAHVVTGILIHEWWIILRRAVIVVILFWNWSLLLSIVRVGISWLAICSILRWRYCLLIWLSLVFAESVTSSYTWSQMGIFTRQHLLMKSLLLLLLFALLLFLSFLLFTLSPSQLILWNCLHWFHIFKNLFIPFLTLCNFSV